MDRCTIWTENMSTLSDLVPSKTILPLLEITSRLPRRMLLHMVIELLARELALADFVLVLARCDAVFGDGIAMAVFNGLGDVGGIVGFVAVPWLIGTRRIRGGRRGGRVWRGGRG